jgi:hypothetical protein
MTLCIALEQRPLWRYDEASTHAPGSARRHLERSSRKLGYLNEAVLPFYVLHSSVIVVTAYFVVQWPIPDPLKAVIIATVAFGAIALLYEGAVRRVRLLRVLFGMKAARHAAGVPREEHLMSSPVRPG